MPMFGWSTTVGPRAVPSGRKALAIQWLLRHG
jgi:hypothetical protein